MKVVFTHANLFDGTEHTELQKNVSVYVEGEKIVSIEPGSKPLHSGSREIDLTGKYLMPGLVNLHAHLFGDGTPSEILGGGESQKKFLDSLKTKAGLDAFDATVKKNAQQALYSGVTTVRAVGDLCYSDVRVRDEINSGKAAGPRLLVAGPAITCKGGHGDGFFSVSSDDPEELKKIVQEHADHGVDLIKICVTGGVMDAKKRGEPGEVKMTLAQVKAVCDKAHSLGLKVAAHTESTPGIEVDLQGGVDTVEHGSNITPEMIDLFRKNGSSLTLTLSPAIPLAKLPVSITKLNEFCVYNSDVLVKKMVEGSKQAIAAGIPVGLGTDCSCPLDPPYNMWREVRGFAKYCGVSNAFALQTATLRDAKIAGVGDITGSVEPGKDADLIVTEKNPLEDLAALRDITMVMARGSLTEHPVVQKNKKMEELLDTIF